MPNSRMEFFFFFPRGRESGGMWTNTGWKSRKSKTPEKRIFIKISSGLWTWKWTWLASDAHPNFGLDTGITWSSLEKPSSSHSLIPHQAINADTQSPKINQIPKKPLTPVLSPSFFSLISVSHLTPTQLPLSVFLGQILHKGRGWGLCLNTQAGRQLAKFFLWFTPQTYLKEQCWVAKGTWIKLFHALSHTLDTTRHFSQSAAVQLGRLLPKCLSLFPSSVCMFCIRLKAL